MPKKAKTILIIFIVIFRGSVDFKTIEFLITSVPEISEANAILPKAKIDTKAKEIRKNDKNSFLFLSIDLNLIYYL